MKEIPVVLVSRDPGLVDDLRSDLESLAGVDVHPVADLEDADLISVARGRCLVVLHRDPTLPAERLAAVVGSLATAIVPVPIVVLAETYDVEEATGLFRRGLVEYVSRSDHREALAEIVASVRADLARALPAAASPARVARRRAKVSNRGR